MMDVQVSYEWVETRFRKEMWKTVVDVDGWVLFLCLLDHRSAVYSKDFDWDPDHLLLQSHQVMDRLDDFDVMYVLRGPWSVGYESKLIQGSKNIF